MDKQASLAWFGVVVSLGLGGCTTDDQCADAPFDGPPPPPEPSENAPPTVLEGEWIGTGVLELSFSKPLAPDVAPDPRRFALASWNARANNYYNASVCSPITSYSQFGRGGYFYGGYAPSVADVWIAPEDPTRLRLRIGSAGSRCPTGQLEQGLMLVYAGGQAEGVTRMRDAEGEPVPSFGPDWSVTSGWETCVLNPEQSNYLYCGLGAYYQGHLPLSDNLAPIPCP